MTDKNSVRFNHGIPLFIGLIIVLFALGNYYFILHGSYGEFSMSELSPRLSSLRGMFKPQKQSVAILNSSYTRNLMPEGSTWMDDNLRTWEKFTSYFGYDTEIISDDYIETDDLKKFNLIILPGSKSLSDKQIIYIKKYLELGGNILATSGTASFSSNGKWRGWDFFSEVFGIKFSREIKNNEIAKTHTLKGGHPLTADIPAGYTLSVATWDKPISVEVLDPRTIQISYWYDYRTETGLMREEIVKTAGIVGGEYGKGRFFWMGFEINSVIGSIENHIYLERLVRNALNWLTRNPISYVRDWPNDHNAAAIILPSVNIDSSASLHILDELKNTAPFDLVVDGNQINLDIGNKLIQLSAFGDIIPEVAFGFPASLDDTSGHLFDYGLQLDNLNRVKKAYEKILNRKTKGVIPKFGLYDRNTLSALLNLEFEFLISDSVNGKSLPKNLYADGKKLVGMNKSSRDDYDVIKTKGLIDPDFQFYTYQEDIDRILFEGGLYIFKPHSDYQLKPEYSEVVKKVIADLNKKNFWITNAKNISDWLNKKNQIEVDVKKMGQSRVQLNVSNTSSNPAAKVEVDVDLSQNAGDIQITAEIIGTKLPSFKKLNDGSLIRLTVDELKPHESRIYFIDYSKNQKIHLSSF